MDLAGITVTALIQMGIGTLFYFAVRRNLDKVDRLEEKLEDLERERIDAMEATQRDCRLRCEREREHEAQSRKELHRDLSEVRRTYVTVAALNEALHEIKSAQQDFRGAVLDLAAIKNEIGNVAAFVSEVNQRGIALLADVARIEGELQGKKG
jgi:chromosome segregation ATPase